MAEASFFEGDLTNRFFGLLGLGEERRRSTFWRVILVWCITWLPLFVLSLLQGLAIGRPPKETFLLDFAAYAQFWIGLPLFVLAEPLLGRMLKEAARHFSTSGLVPAHDEHRYHGAIAETAKWRTSVIPELLLLLLSIVFSALWLREEIADGISTWHAPIVGGLEHVSLAGLWLGFVAAPLFQFFLYRWVWKVLLWVRFLWHMSRIELRLNCLHPDSCGGLGFIGTVQGGFGILVFAVGCVVASTIGYKIVISGNPLSAFGLWGPIAAFIVFAPALFLLPLLLFTKKSFDVKEQGVLEVARLAGTYVRKFDDMWISAPRVEPEALMGSPDIQSLAALTTCYSTAHGMRIVPFDLRSVLQLLVAAVSPYLPFLLKWFPPGVKNVVLQMLGGGH